MEVRDLVIAIGQRANSKSWTNKRISWEQLCEKLSHTIYTAESVAEYKTFLKEAKQEAKDHGGFVGGKLSAPQRLKANIEYRSMVTLDVDDAELDFLKKFIESFEYTCCLYSTHGHRDDSPRFRLIIPLSRDIDGDEYVAVSRLLADSLGIEQVDPVSFSVNQLMYWPSTPNDGNYIYRKIDKTLLNPDSFLANYPNWKDLTTLPKKAKETHVNSGKPGRKQADPLTKDGIVGAFCRAYTISEAIDTFLPDIYEPVGDNRYHYIPASSTAGAINYDDKLFYSHHANDPASEMELNAFNLVKVHLYGNDNTAFKKMVNLARNDEKVKSLIASENIKAAKEDFGDGINFDWMKQLSTNDDGTIKNNLSNLVTILQNDENLKSIAFNTLANISEVRGIVPWSRVGSTKYWRDGDTAQLKIYIEKHYCDFSDRNFENAFKKVTEDRAFNPVKDYLNNLPKWDGVKRLEDIFIKYLEADDNDYTREVTRKWFAAAIARIYDPGVKFDNIIVLDGKQGVGKSTIIKSLVDPDFFSDSLQLSDMDDTKKAGEKVQGFWIIEIQELAGMRKADIEKVKAFISSNDDKYRASYGHHVEVHPRQCIIFATVNGERGYLRDLTGNRRFWIIKINSKNVTPDFAFTKEFKDQVWAEAKHYYEHGEKLFLSGEFLEAAEEYQNNAMEHDDRTGLVEEYLNHLLPDNWDECSIADRRYYFNKEFDSNYYPQVTYGPELYQREEVSPIEIWCECLGNDRGRFTSKESNPIIAIMAQIPGWEKSGKRKTMGPYGKQQYYVRTKK